VRSDPAGISSEKRGENPLNDARHGLPIFVRSNGLAWSDKLNTDNAAKGNILVAASENN